MQSDIINTIVFIGPTGVGKSRLINYLAEKDVAKTANTLQSVTKGLQCYCVNPQDSTHGFLFVDTQGVCDTTMSNADVVSLISDALKNKVKKVNYFILMIKSGRMTDENRKAIEQLITEFDLVERKNHVYVLVTNCEILNGQALTRLENEVCADRTLKKLLKMEKSSTSSCHEVVNLSFTGLPDPKDVNVLMMDGVRKWMEVQRKPLMKYISKPISAIEPNLRCQTKHIDLFQILHCS
ncbi:hypothetical protein PPL_12381 [Heterostelium album PN500]|uniref:AIG1-type G domain-containing protein n=1 Tax=Heterostelium pallidum (strain ATCC 26659 / Pp 5 / PN500) TaxID=670386 RepID=D3BMG1_HETP5|nr:hypothetical protein PPL_12381 [Heterostelium album PN500]EFA77173.1 hypothetical protein PPL_12381 [Heterostelium album PN500]|eukprot:XP_020429302.1 hypothetical protein PPL_12381 [Heterostelium album PN500]